MKRSMRAMNARAPKKPVLVSRTKRRTPWRWRSSIALRRYRTVLAREMDHQTTTGVAVDQASGEGTLGAEAEGDAYVDNGSSVAAFSLRVC